jgi:hypothetical protein
MLGMGLEDFIGLLLGAVAGYYVVAHFRRTGKAA